MEISYLKDILEGYEGLIAFMKHKFRPQSVLDLNEFVRLEKECANVTKMYEDFLSERERVFEERRKKLGEVTTIDDLRQGLKESQTVCEKLVNRLEEMNKELDNDE